MVMASPRCNRTLTKTAYVEEHQLPPLTLDSCGSLTLLGVKSVLPVVSPGKGVNSKIPSECPLPSHQSEVKQPLSEIRVKLGAGPSKTGTCEPVVNVLCKLFCRLEGVNWIEVFR